MAKLGTLVTAADAREAVKAGQLATSKGLPLIVDSGAWSNFTKSANVTVEGHIEFLKANWIDGARHVGLDVIGDGEATFANWRRERLEGLAVEPTLHFGDDPKTIDRYLAEGLATDWVNLGGMAHLQRRRSLHPNMAKWCAAVMRRCPSSTKFHGLGVMNPSMLSRVPFNATDSTKWMNVTRFKDVNLFDYERCEWMTIRISTRSPSWDTIAQRSGRQGIVAKRLYGLNTSTMLTFDDEQLISLAFRSHARLAKAFEQRYGHEFTVYMAGATSAHFDLIKTHSKEAS